MREESREHIKQEECSWCAFPSAVRFAPQRWLIPLFNGKPIIRKGKRGPAPRWRNPQKPAKTVVHVNTHKIRQNQKESIKQPVITVKKGNTNQYAYEVEIPGGCRVVYRPDRSICGAKVWIESLYDVKVIDLEAVYTGDLSRQIRQNSLRI